MFLGWTLEDGTTGVDTTAEIAESMTVKANFAKYMLYTPKALMAEKESGNLVFASNRYLFSTVSYDSRNFLHLQAKTGSSSSHSIELTFDSVLAGYEVVVIAHITNTRRVSEGSNVQTMTTSTSSYVTQDRYLSDETEITEVTDEQGNLVSVTGSDDLFAIYSITGDVYKLKFAPWHGRTITGDAPKCIGPAKISGDAADAYVDIEYIALFENAEAVEVFDYSLYGKAEYDINVIGYGSETPVVVKVQKNNLIPVDGIITQYVDSNGTLMVISAWEIEGETYSVDSYLVTGSCTATAVYAPAYILSAADGTITVVYIGGSAISGTGASNKAYSWASLTTKYLQTKFDQVFAYNVGLGGQGSRSAAFRLQKDVIDYKPDIVFVETSMNDHYDGEMVNGVYGGKYYEYIIRTIREALPNTEIITAYTINNGLVKKSDNTLIDGKLHSRKPRYNDVSKQRRRREA